jgi:AcrR family transcriptional regulator
MHLLLSRETKSTDNFMPTRHRPRRTKRKQGRPQKDKPAVGPDALIAATRQLMRTTPPAQITRLDIARVAGVDPGLIRYYFGDKSELIVTAALQAGAELREQQVSNVIKPGTPSEKIIRRVSTLLDSLFEDPSLHHLIIESIIHGRSKEARQVREDMVYGTIKELSVIIDQGVGAGEFCRVDPRFLFLALVGVCSYPMAERALFNELAGEEPDREYLDRYKEFVSQLLLYGLSGPPQKRKPQ